MSDLAFDLSAPLGGHSVLLSRTFADLSLAVQQLGQWENSADITPQILLQAINYALIEGYDIIVQKWLDYYTLSVTFAIVSGTDTYALSDIPGSQPAFYKLRHLDVSADGVRFQRCYPHDLEAAYRYTANTASSIFRVRYRIQGGNLVFVPVPPAGVAKFYYIPLPPQFASVDDTSAITFDVPTNERLIVHLAMRDLLVRSDLNTASIDAKIDRLTAQLRTAADSRDAGEPFSLNPNGPRREFCEVIEDEGWY